MNKRRSLKQQLSPLPNTPANQFTNYYYGAPPIAPIAGIPPWGLHGIAGIPAPTAVPTPAHVSPPAEPPSSQPSVLNDPATLSEYFQWLKAEKMKYFPEKLSDALEALLSGYWSIVDLRNEPDDKLAKIIPAKGLRNGIRRNLQDFITRKRDNRPSSSSSRAPQSLSIPISIDDDNDDNDDTTEEFEREYSD